MAHERLVEGADLAVEDQRPSWETRDGGGDVGEAPSVIDPAPAHESHAAAVLAREYPLAVDLLFVDPAVAVEGFGDRRCIATMGDANVAMDTDGQDVLTLNALLSDDARTFGEAG